ncbi:MAG TPA: hypothetical protein DCE18_04555 [Syntrophobacteraceae bacterium]|nr:hypothetical protein [Syntrophobacteraceae bacterium]
MEGMARAGAGEPFVVTKPEEAPAIAEKFRQYVQSPVLTHIKLDFGGLETYDVEPASIPDVFAERPVIVFGKWRGQPKGTISLRGYSGVHAYEQKTDVTSVKPLATNSALRSLWARSVITRLSDYNILQKNDQRIAEVTELGLKYSLLTAYTSFVAIDSKVRRTEGDLTRIDQPLPLPEGVSDYAVGGGIAGAPVAMQGMAKSLAMGSQPSTAPFAYGRPAAPARGAADRRVSAERGDGWKSAARPGGRTELSDKEEPAENREGKSEDIKGRDQSDWMLRIDKLLVTGGLSETAVKRVIEENAKDIANCLRVGVTAGAGEKLTLRWTLDGRGRVVDVKIVSASAGTRAMGKCLAENVRQWGFDAPAQSGAIVTVTFAVELSRK